MSLSFLGEKWSFTLAVSLIILDQLIAIYLVLFLPDQINPYDRRFLAFLPSPLAIGLAAGVVLWLTQELSGPAGKIALSLMSAGLISNALTLLWYGKFIDYLPQGFWYVNLADWMVVLGCTLSVVVIIWSWRSPRPA